MKEDPFFIEGPALISFSGGRTSAFMLRKILDRGLQSDVHVLFANTGKENEATLDFVHECSLNWGIEIRWLQYRRNYLPSYRSFEVRESAARIQEVFELPAFELAHKRIEPGYVEVTYETAARSDDAPSVDHPFTNLVAISGVPNAMTRLCTTELKIRPMKKFMLAQGYDSWTNVVGIRGDEPTRISRMRAPTVERWDNHLPLADAMIGEKDVLRFWAQQSFDLRLKHDAVLGTYQGNCDLCHLKSDGKKVQAARDNIASLDWWQTVEDASDSFFRPRFPYREVRRLALLSDGPTIDDAMTDLGDCICHD